MTTVRVWFTKTGESAYISLLDLQRVMQRAFKRSRLPVWYTQGFNPHIYMTFAAPLSLGQESLVESLDFKTESETLDWEDAARVLTECLPHGIEVVRVEPAQMDPKEIAFAHYIITYSAAFAQPAQAAFEAFEKAETAVVKKKTKKGTMKDLDLKQHVVLRGTRSTPDGGFQAKLQLPAGSVLNINPVLVLEYLAQHSGLPVTAGDICRVALLTKEKENFV